jgi:hypothetical protein
MWIPLSAIEVREEAQPGARTGRVDNQTTESPSQPPPIPETARTTSPLPRPNSQRRLHMAAWLVPVALMAFFVFATIFVIMARPRQENVPLEERIGGVSITAPNANAGQTTGQTGQ